MAAKATSKKAGKFYITTAIDYPNGKPHMGHAYEKIVTDAFARWHALKGEDVFFLTGTDENSQKILQAAEKHSMKPKDFVDKYSALFVDFAKQLDLSNNDFIRTTEERHKKVAKQVFQKVLDKGDIYKGTYTGYYCVHEETFYTERQAGPAKVCPMCGRQLQLVEEDAYFFRMSRYQKQIIDYIKKNNFIFPESRKNEILYRLENDDLKDLCVSRSSIRWGIPLPNDASQVIYVWFDALINYISGIHEPKKRFEKYWPADVHVIGKDIIWFHTVIWPTMLMAAGIELPKMVYAHGFINDAAGEKMSKSKGNVMDPVELIKLYGVDALRYYLLKNVVSGEDGLFSSDELVERYNNELANDLGNLLMRIAKLAEKNFDGKVGKTEAYSKDFMKASFAAFEKADKFMLEMRYDKALSEIWLLINRLNSYINDKEPWKVKDKEELQNILYNACEGLYFAALILMPFIPTACAKILKQIDAKQMLVKDFRFGDRNYSFKKVEVPFPKVEVKKGKNEPVKQKFDDPFAKVELMTARIMSVEDHPQADKLYVLKVHCPEERTLVAGLRVHYTSGELMGKNIIIVRNLKPAKLRGIESKGMLLAVDGPGGRVGLITHDETPGKRVVVDGIDYDGTKEIDIDFFANLKLKAEKGKVMYGKKELKLKHGKISIDKVSEGLVR